MHPIVDMSPRVRILREVKCHSCGTLFTPKAPNQKYCGLACQKQALKKAKPRQRFHALRCRNCGKSFVPQKPNQLDCCLACHHQWINRRRQLERAERRLEKWAAALRWSEEEAERVNEALKDALDPCPM